MDAKRNNLIFLKLIVEDHPLFGHKASFSVINDKRVSANNADQLTNLFGHVWVNNLISIVGKNATGKTTLMKLLIGTLTLLLSAKSIDQTQLSDVLFGTEPIKLVTYFYGSDMVVYKDQLLLKLNDEDHSWHVADEKIYSKSVNNKTSRSTLLDFKDHNPRIDRQRLDKLTASVLASDDSVFRTILSQKKYLTQPIIDTLVFTNVNALIYNKTNVPETILHYLDPTIEYLKLENQQVEGGRQQLFYRLKFYTSDQEITDTNFATIEHYLSSGTAKGVTLYGNVLYALRTGGIIFIDELENHFNHAIVRSFIEYFSNPQINVNRATLIFSTHYSELLDDLERGDEIYVTKRKKDIELQRYSKANVRNELKRSDVFDSDYLGGTAPDYDAYLDLRKATERAVRNGK